ncbi:hypothetical protein PNI02_19420 [Pseudoalteromonas nigrifaciens]|nr:hypothetical protein PNI02_19420 [Pseudoalteromonas nigrifaciens]
MSKVLLGMKYWLSSSNKTNRNTTLEPIYKLHDNTEYDFSLNAKLAPRVSKPNKQKCPTLSP